MRISPFYILAGLTTAVIGLAACVGVDIFWKESLTETIQVGNMTETFHADSAEETISALTFEKQRYSVWI
jgi:hypothetical protein